MKQLSFHLVHLQNKSFQSDQLFHTHRVFQLRLISVQQYIVAKRTLAVTTQRCQLYTLHCCQQCTISVTVHRCKRYIVTKTPSTGLRHPSLEEGAGKRCSECDCYLHSALFRYTGANSTLLQHTVANSTLLVLQYTVANSTLLPPLLPTVHISVHWC